MSKHFIRQLVQDAKAMLRGERRVAEGLRGRTHERKDKGNSDSLAPKAKGEMSIKLNHIEAADGRKYTIEEWMRKHG